MLTGHKTTHVVLFCFYFKSYSCISKDEGGKVLRKKIDGFVVETLYALKMSKFVHSELK